MRYYLTDSTLIIRGNFRACSTSTGGGIKNVTSLLNHTVSDTLHSSDPDRTIDLVARRSGLTPLKVFGLLTAVPITDLYIAKYEKITIFITAGVTHPDPIFQNQNSISMVEQNPTGTINIICCFDGGMADQGLLDALITVTEAKAIALRGLGYQYAGTVTDAVIIATEGEGSIRYAGSATSVGIGIHEATIQAVTHALKSQNQTIKKESEKVQKEPVFFIHSTIGGGKWVEWQRKGCQYYPCHFAGQRCEFCYCPLYPCLDERLGEWTCKSNQKGRVWNCSPCSLNHQPAVVRHLQSNPEASVYELKSLMLEKNTQKIGENYSPKTNKR